MHNLNPDYVLVPFKSLLGFCQNNVLIGLRLCEGLEKFPEPTQEELQFNMQLSLNSHLTDLGQNKLIFKGWILRNGFEEIHKSIRITLERLFVFMSLTKELNSTSLLDTIEREKKFVQKANKLHFPQLVEQVNILLGSPLKYLQHIESMNNARNCLVHGNGIVTPKNANFDDKLVITGSRFKMFFKDGENEVPLIIGETGPVNAPLMFGAEEFTIEFAVGESIDISLKQFIDILNTCIFLDADISVRIDEYRSTS